MSEPDLIAEALASIQADHDWAHITLSEEIERLSKALGFYANEKTWKRKRRPDEHWIYISALQDGGEIARAALEGTDGKN